MADVLRAICDRRRKQVNMLKSATVGADLAARIASQSAPRGFIAALKTAIAAGRYGLIAEIKKASPSKGLIRGDFQPAILARAYHDGGATCLSVLTEPDSFMGADDDLVAAREAVPLPVLRKDFMVDPWQVDEARSIGADCILIIMAALDDHVAMALAERAFALGMDVLVEVHDAAELERCLALDLPPENTGIGINNRNLKTLGVNLETALALAPSIPEGFLRVGESGLSGPDDLARLSSRAKVNCFLIGEALMRRQDVAAATRALLS